MPEIKEWAKIDLNGESCGVASMPFDSFLPENGYRLVVQRRAVGKNIFGTVYVYRCILTNGHDSPEKEVIEYYNARGAQERVFDRMNNDFGWKRLPFSSLKQNTVFFLVMAMLSNFYLLLVSGLSRKLDFVKPTDRLKRFVFRFVSVPAKWVRTARQWKLILYTYKPYMNALGTWESHFVAKRLDLPFGGKGALYPQAKKTRLMGRQLVRQDLYSRNPYSPNSVSRFFYHL